MKVLHADFGTDSYDIFLERGCLQKAGEYLNLDRKVLVITDSGVPSVYAKTIRSFCKEGYISTIPAGEKSKNFEQYSHLLHDLVRYGFSRKDCIVACGGGVVGDLAGFVASTYMRGIDFYNVPTTTIAQTDSSIGGKCAIDFDGYKNIIGSFYQPKAVLVDMDTFMTQSRRALVSGLAEAIKIGLIGDRELFEIFERGEAFDKIDEVVYRSLKFKRDVIVEDPKEKGIRAILNFGHTIGHAIEAAADFKLYHGECVGIGMVKITDDEALRNRIINVLKMYDLPTDFDYDKSKAMDALKHDKKGQAKNTKIIKVNEVGKAEIEIVKTESLRQYL